MARRKQLKFTVDADAEELIKKWQAKYPEASFSMIINMMLRKAK